MRWGAVQIALFVAPVLVLASYVLGPSPMSLQFWPGAVVMMLIATLTATLVSNTGRAAWFLEELTERAQNRVRWFKSRYRGRHLRQKCGG